VAAGIGVYSPYGLEIDWKDPDSFTGRYISTQSKITPFFFVPTVAWAPSPRIRLGAGAQLALSTVKLERHIAVYNPLADRVEDVGTVTLDSHPGFAAGFNAGVQWWPDDKWRVGATYRSKLTISYDGTADFEQRPTGDPTFDAIVAAGFPKDQGVNTSIPFPAQGSLGVGLQVSPSLALEADFNYTWWSAFDRLDVSFQTNSERDLHIEENWDDVFNIRTGFEYRHAGTSPWAFRGGYYFDQSPQPTEGVGPLLPDADRHGICGGLGWRNAKWSVDAYALYLIIPDRSTEGVNRDNYNGTYSDTSVLGGLSIGAHF
jgi:long-chain fatty acid transport protein